MNLRSAGTALSVSLCLLLAGCGGLPAIPGAEPSTTASAPTATAPEVVPPTEVRVASIDASSPLVATHLNPDGTAEVPPVDQPLQASYLDWADTIENQRPLVVYGHVNGRDAKHRSVPGVFAKLSRVKPGDEVVVAYANGSSRTYRITNVQQVSKHADPAKNDPGFPTAAVYDATPKPTIRLVTCTGPFDSSARSYVDNFIAYGELKDQEAA